MNRKERELTLSILNRVVDLLTLLVADDAEGNLQCPPPRKKMWSWKVA